MIVTIACLLVFVPSFVSSTLTYIPALEYQGSRDNLIATYFKLGLSYSEIISFLLLCHGIKLGVRQLKRILSVNGLRRRKQHTPLAVVIDVVGKELQGSGSCIGYRAMHQRLRVNHGLIVNRETVRKVIKGLDPDGVDYRTQKRFRRRQYYSQGPNYLWHLDGYDKLKPFGFCIHGAIDGYSRRIMWLQVGPSNNNPSIIAQYFIDCVREVHGIPALVRGDCGTENGYVAAIQRYLKRANHVQVNGYQSSSPGFLYGKSTANQRIEAWWSTLRKSNSSWWINLFKDMRDSGVYSNHDTLQVNCLQFCFMPIIQKELDMIARLWNLHHIRPSRNSDSPPGKPDVLYFLPERSNALDYKQTFTDMDLKVAETVYGERKPRYGCNKAFGELARMIMLENNLQYPNDANQASHLYNRLLFYISQI